MPEISGATYTGIPVYNAGAGRPSQRTLRFNLVEGPSFEERYPVPQSWRAQKPDCRRWCRWRRTFPESRFNRPPPFLQASADRPGPCWRCSGATRTARLRCWKKVTVAGEHQVVFNAGELAAGMYCNRLQTSAGVVTRKMTLVKVSYGRWRPAPVRVPEPVGGPVAGNAEANAC